MKFTSESWGYCLQQTHRQESKEDLRGFTSPQKNRYRFTAKSILGGRIIPGQEKCCVSI